MTYSEAQKNLIRASFELRQAQSDLDEAQRRFNEAVTRVDLLEKQTGASGPAESI